MWRSSSRRPVPARGFTLLEAMVSLLLLVIVLTVAMSMLFQMRAFAERQQFYMLPRQTARRAADYLSYYVAGASDLNDRTSPRTSPNALVMYYNVGSPGVPIQASYDNLDGSEAGNAITVPNVSTKFGDLGTDVITLIAPTSPAKYLAAPTFGGLGAGIDFYFNFRGGCATNDTANLDAFKTATGFDGTQSALLTLLDRNGDWIYFQIPSAGYLTDGLCSDVTTYRNIHVRADTQSATLPAPPNGTASLADPVSLVTGIQVISFRVLTDPADNVPKLQQKLGLFDPATDNPGTAFVNVMENVEDLQVAYVYAVEPVSGAGTFWNTATQVLTDPGRVPPQAGPASAPGGTDITNVIGVRFSITSRSPRLGLGAQQLTNVGSDQSLASTTSLHFRPASENHAVTMDPVHPTRPLYDLFDHYRATSMLMLRNRTLGS
jgi:type II secretory pathway pseudopilin PulG